MISVDGRRDGDGRRINFYIVGKCFVMARGQKATPRREWAETTKQKQIQWQKENRAKLSADLPKQDGDFFREICKRNNISVSAALSVFVRACLQSDSLDVIQDDIPGQKNIDPAFQQGDKANENDTPGTVDSHPGFDTPGTVDLPTANDTHGTVD